jgi:hypothetical protein
MGNRLKTGACELCGRSPIDLTFHHLIPVTLHKNQWFKARFTRAELRMGLNICLLCHDGIHSLIPEKELGRKYNTRENLLSHERLTIHVKWVARQKY